MLILTFLLKLTITGTLRGRNESTANKIDLINIPGQKEFLENNPTAGVDFPMKMLVWEGEDGKVRITYNDPVYLQERHQIEGMDEKISETGLAFKKISQASAKSKSKSKSKLQKKSFSEV